ncbi:DnaJ-domain-containing protein [Lepidopterella palustris CBS 459.81]|uniref:DnaJ-domain-containing protein n=1 Tax=Lepidopterella palustris CBS 459.81 TaxID=1314670 RepID=A0A8E2EG86_9PEZI|nr:DnaJ-domain-containing protein [Lepidopterella palustris CBS 459.81]
MAPAIPTHDYYVILEVLPSATHEEIKTSYRRLARLHHPDKNGGSWSATVKTQLINAAWDVLGNSCKRSEYDNIYHAQTNASTGSRPNASKPTTTAQSSWQPPRPSTTTQNNARAQAESQKKRQEWLNWEMLQEQSIRQCQKQVKALETDIAALSAKIKENRKKLANDAPYWWNVFASLSTRLSEAEKNELRRQILDSDAAIRIKQLPLDSEQSRLQRLKDDLSRRRDQENERVAAELKEKEKRERLAREKAEAEARRRYAEEYARQQAAMEAREKAAKEEAARAETARQKENGRGAARAPKAESERLQRLAEKQMAKNKEEVKRRQTRKMLCRHNVWWNEVPGPHDCTHCTRPLYRFAYQCPGCKTIACASCRGTLKAGRTPSIDNSHNKRQEHAHPSRANGKGRRVPSPEWDDGVDHAW